MIVRFALRDVNKTIHFWIIYYHFVYSKVSAGGEQHDFRQHQASSGECRAITSGACPQAGGHARQRQRLGMNRKSGLCMI